MFFFHFRKKKIRRKNFASNLISPKKIFYTKITQQFSLKNFLKKKKKTEWDLFFRKIKIMQKNILKNDKFFNNFLCEMKNFRSFFFINKANMLFFNGFFKHRFKNFLKFHRKIFVVLLIL